MKKRRLFAAVFVLAVLLFLGIFSLPAKIQAATIATGTCGDNLTWALDDAGVLTISGTGSMLDYSYRSDVPWYSYCKDIKSVVFVGSVTSVGRYAFYDCGSLQTLTIPESITAIGDYAFSKCSTLRTLQIENGVTHIGFFAFSYCENLLSVNFGNKLENICNYAFYYCDKLQTVTIPDSVTNIGKGAFDSCAALQTVRLGKGVEAIVDTAFDDCPKITGFWVDPENVHYFHDDRGVLYHKTGSALVLAPRSLSGSYTVQPGIATIRDYAFYECDKLLTVNMGNDVTTVGQFAFESCDNLQTVDLGKGISTLYGFAFASCYNLETVSMGAGIRTIDSYAFSECTSLATVYYGGTEIQWQSVSSILGDENWVLDYADIKYRHTHDYTGTAPVRVESTCTQTGYVDYTCTHGETYREYLPLGDHDYQNDPLTCGNCSYVRADMAITDVVLRPSCTGLYFKGAFTFGAEENVIRHGIAVSLYNNLPVADDTDRTSLYTVSENSVLISNILGEGENGKTLIYVRPYALLADGTYLYGGKAVTNLKAVVEAVDVKFDSLTTAQQTVIADMYRQNTAAMQSWLIPKIKEFAAQ